MTNVQVYSEIGRLREVVVHRPGRELVRMTPSTREQFLFDDLLYTRHAQMEHDWFTSLLGDHLGITVHPFHTLLTDALEAAPASAREALLHQVCLFEAEPLPLEQRVAQLEDEVARLRYLLTLNHPRQVEPESPLRPIPGYLEDYLLRRAAEGQFAQLAGELIEGIESSSTGPVQGFDNPEHWPPGDLDDADRLTRFVEDRMFHLSPLPNLMFLRDAATVVGNRLVLSRMAAKARRRETLLFDFVCAHHPRFAGVERWAAGPRANRHLPYGDAELPYWEEPTLELLPEERYGAFLPHAAYLECGNIAMLRRDIVAVGISPRTTMPAVQRLVNSWEEAAAAEGRTLALYVLRLPSGHNHLDSVFTLVGPAECVLYPPVFEPYGPDSVDVIRMEIGAGKRRSQAVRRTSFLDSLRDDGMPLTAIPCGGSDPIDQQREEWFSAANMLTVAPGKVITYRSTPQTVAGLVAQGYRAIDAVDVLEDRQQISLDDDEKWVIRIRGSELSRGHGGPHSLALPLVRDEL